METNNILTRPQGPEYELVVGEGSYRLKDVLLVATPPPHPSDAPQPNNNPLATTIGPPQSGTKVNLVSFSPRQPPSQSLFRTRTSVSQAIQEETTSPRSDAGSILNGFGSASYYSRAPGFGDSNPLLHPVVSTKGKKDQRLKPKTNMIKSNSSYVSRVISHDQLPKRLAERSPDGLMAFLNVNRAFMWMDLSSETKTENLAKVLFTKAHALCHDVNSFTKSSNHLDVIIGFNTGDIIWYEPFSIKYTRLNKNGIINPSPISSIAWIPNKDYFFVAAHNDGTLLVYDKDKEDAWFTPESSTPVAENGHANGNKPRPGFRVLKSVQSQNQKTNPIAAWKISNMKINAIAFSPDGQFLAVACEDGALTILDYINERILDVYRAYYGAMLCVTWSPDGRYVLTGGQDDLVSIWSLADRALIARCVGHESWVTDVKFDPWRCDGRNYRFGSVGEDCRLLFWDFSVGMLRRPKAMSLRNNRSSIATMGGSRKESQTPANRVRTNSGRGMHPDDTDDEDAEVEMVHAVDTKSSTTVLPPVMSKAADPHPLCWLGFEENCVLTSCKDGGFLSRSFATWTFADVL